MVRVSNETRHSNRSQPTVQNIDHTANLFLRRIVRLGKKRMLLRCDLHPYPLAHSKSTRYLFPSVAAPAMIPVYISLLLVLWPER